MAGEAIPTTYAGIRFRSRNEARYAKFFDELGIKWEWEPRGQSSSNEWYLPDFMVFAAAGTIWCEIKYADEDPWSPDVMRFRRFVLERPMPSRAALFTGQPAQGGNILVFSGDPEVPWEDDTLEWMPCPSGHHFDLIWPGKWHGKVVEDGCEPCPGNGGEDRILKAVRAAKNARFGVHEDPTGSAN